MAKFTAGVDLNIRLPNGEELIGAAGTTHRFSDALVDEFVRDVVPHIPGFAWVNQDETSAIANGASVSVAAETTYGVSSSAGTAASYSRGDHTHGSPSLATTAASTLTIGNAASTGTATLPARADHAHGLPAFAAVTAATSYGISSADGTAATVARSDHTHGSVANPIISGSGFTVASGNLALSASSQALVVPGLLRFGGTSFPASPSTNDLFFRTDLGLEFFYDGTRWLSAQILRAQMGPEAWSATYATQISASQTVVAMGNNYHGFGSDLYLIEADISVAVATGGTALSASHKWVATLYKTDTAGAITSLGTWAIDSGANGSRSGTITIGAVLGTWVTYPNLRLDWAKTGTPGALQNVSTIPVTVLYRIVAT